MVLIDLMVAHRISAGNHFRMIQLVTGSVAAGILDRLQSGDSGLLESGDLHDVNVAL